MVFLASIKTIINSNTPDQEIKLHEWRFLIQEEETWEVEVCS